IESLERLRSNSSTAIISEQIIQTIQQAWIYGSLELSDTKVRTGHLIIGMLETRPLKDSLMSLSREFKKIDSDELLVNFNKICKNSPESKQSSIQTDATDNSEQSTNLTSEKSALESYASNLTEKAKNGEIDPVVGRDEEIRQIIDILMRRRQNNPILTGEAGVGKTAVAEGFALRVAKGDVPPDFKNVTLYALDVGALQAGASMKGEFEERLKSVIEEVQASETPIILFIDEAHTLIGAGGAAGTGDAANLLKPALARGTLRTIAATTWAEYKKYFEKDPALTRRFQVVQIDEPDEQKGIQMMRCLTDVMEAHHKVLILDEALEASVKLSHRYIPARQLPDKSISVLDTACARVGVSQHATPSVVEDHQKELEMYQTEKDIIQREIEIGIDTKKRLPEVEAKIQQKEELLSVLEERWEKEKILVEKIIEARAKLQSKSSSEQTTDEVASNTETTNNISPETVIDATHIDLSIKDNSDADLFKESIEENSQDKEALLAELHQLQDQLVEMQGDTPLVLPTVNA
ncbi:MAG: AAA family ATPase, partial [Gammaproteobacteria bacterium]|nr:AAA family ATPase [Gammaproteobacteria bacterium]